MHSPKSHKNDLLLSLSALGIVFGDIGTSPLYAIKEIVLHLGEASRDAFNVLGFTSIVIWALTIIITLKYVTLVLRADNQGEGGVFALYALLQKTGTKGKRFIIISLLLLFAVGMLFGDGIITPAISVISAIEGLGVITSRFNPLIIPITIAILISIFAIQSKGTHKIGNIFGPIIAIWFAVIAALAIPHILSNPTILQAFNPLYAIRFLFHHDLHSITLVLGAVMLVVTGGEALYADMGHFGKSPIKISWFSLAYPALVLNYLGQGAFLLSDKTIINHNIFFSMSPSWAITPLVILATSATIIASQALITGTYSLVTQGISLGLIPMLKVKHTHQSHAGQIFVPSINQALLIGCILLVLIFQTSSNLASAYGLAVSSVMLITTIAITFIANKIWHWSNLKSALVFTPLLIIDSIFLLTNSAKFLKGGFIPFLIGLGVLGVMLIWRWGKRYSRQSYANIKSITVQELIKLKQQSKDHLPRTFFVMTHFPPTKPNSHISVAGQIILDRYGSIPHHLIFVTVKTHRVPYMNQDRYTITPLYKSKSKGTITGVILHFGFMEAPRVEPILEELANKQLITTHPDRKLWLMNIIGKRFFFFRGISKFQETIMHIFRFIYFESKTPDEYYGLGNRIRLSVDILPVKTRN